MGDVLRVGDTVCDEDTLTDSVADAVAVTLGVTLKERDALALGLGVADDDSLDVEDTEGLVLTTDEEVGVTENDGDGAVLSWLEQPLIDAPERSCRQMRCS